MEDKLKPTSKISIAKLSHKEQDYNEGSGGSGGGACDGGG